MNTDDPYTPPLVDPEMEAQTTELAPVVVVEHLKYTRVWVKFCSIIGFVSSALFTLIGAYTLSKVTDKLEPPYPYLLGAFYLILSVLFFIPSVKLSQYEKSITKLVITRNLEDLEFSIAHQQAFWKQVAIMIFLIMMLYVATITFSTYIIIKFH